MPLNLYIYALSPIVSTFYLWIYQTTLLICILLYTLPMNIDGYVPFLINTLDTIVRVVKYEVHTISFQTFFVRAFKIVVDSWEFSMLFLYSLWDDWPIFMISDSNKQLQQEFECTLLKPDCHSWWISKMQYGREDTLEERYVIKLCFKLGKKCLRNIWNASDCFSTIIHESGISFWVA